MSNMTADFMLRLFQEVDMPELREICDEDEWIRHQRHIYHRVRKGLDSDRPLEHLLEQATEDEFVAMQKGWAK